MAALALVLGFVAPANGAGVPVEPGNARPQDFRSAETCVCHKAYQAQWRQSMMAQAITDPVFQLKVNAAEAEAGSKVADFCRRCHSPIGNMLRDPNGEKYVEASEGVTCMFCHQVTGDTRANVNVSQILVPDLTRRGQLKHPVAPHPAAYSAYYSTSAFCGNCHNVTHPLTGVPLDTTYDEWKASPYAKAGIECQDCHMSATPGEVGPYSGRAAPLGAPRPNLYSMTFTGANVGQGPPSASMAMLRTAAAVRIKAPDILPENTTTSTVVTVVNVGAGHDLPTGLTDERQMWLTVYLQTLGGTRTKIGERHFGTVLEDASGRHPTEMWNAAKVYSSDVIGPRESKSSTYSFKMPLNAAQCSVVAVLSYKSVPDNVAAEAGVFNPTTEMVSASKVIYPTQAAKNTADAMVAGTTAYALPMPTPAAGIWTPLQVALVFAALVLGAGILIMAVPRTH